MTAPSDADGELIDGGLLEVAMRQVVAEAAAIAAACGVPLDVDVILADIRAVAEATRDNKSSMYQDLEKGRRTEIDAINGALIGRARERGLQCPVNELLARMVKAAQNVPPNPPHSERFVFTRIRYGGAYGNGRFRRGGSPGAFPTPPP